MSDATVVLAIVGAATGTASALTQIVGALRDRPRLRLSMGAQTAVGQRPTGWFDVLNDGPRATTVREVGLYARPTSFEIGPEDRKLVGTGHAQFPVGGPVFLEAGETRRFMGYPEIDTFGLHVDFPLRMYAIDARDRRIWGNAGPVMRWLVGPDPPLQDSDPEDFKALFKPLDEPPLPWAVEPKWKLWKRRELRNPRAYKAT